MLRTGYESCSNVNLNKEVFMRRFYKIIIPVLIFFITTTSFAWNHGVAIGYGGDEDMNHHQYKNYGTILWVQLASLKQKNWMHITFGGSVGDWNSTYVIHRSLFTAALTFSLRAYLFRFLKAHPYFLVSVGPAYLSHRHFGQNTQAANVAFQSILGGGVEIGQEKRVDINVKLVHYSNGYLGTPNEGFNIFPVFSVGYMF